MAQESEKAKKGIRSFKYSFGKLRNAKKHIQKNVIRKNITFGNEKAL